MKKTFRQTIIVITALILLIAVGFIVLKRPVNGMDSETTAASEHLPESAENGETDEEHPMTADDVAAEEVSPELTQFPSMEIDPSLFAGAEKDTLHDIAVRENLFNTAWEYRLSESNYDQQESDQEIRNGHIDIMRMIGEAETSDLIRVFIENGTAARAVSYVYDINDATASGDLRYKPSGRNAETYARAVFPDADAIRDIRRRVIYYPKTGVLTERFGYTGVFVRKDADGSSHEFYDRLENEFLLERNQ